MNDWLKIKEKRDKKKLDRETLGQIDELVKNWQDTGGNLEMIKIILDVIARNVIEGYKRNKMTEKETRDNIQDMIDVCVEKLRRINTSKGRAFNYFTTVMLCVLRQNTMTTRDFKEIKKKYHDNFAGWNNGVRD
jgi:hypothetical protein